MLAIKVLPRDHDTPTDRVNYLGLHKRIALAVGTSYGFVQSHPVRFEEKKSRSMSFWVPGHSCRGREGGTSRANVLQSRTEHGWIYD